MKFLVYLFIAIFFAFVFYGVISFVRFAYSHIKSFVIRRKLLKLSESEKKDD